MSKPVRTRFAPSPTGFQHVGGFRTAFYAYLFARHHGGKFLLRVEDTDRARFVPGSVKFILDEFAWLGIEVDEGPSPDELRAIGEPPSEKMTLSGGHGPYTQSLRKAKYQQAAQYLIDHGYAYRCDCTPEMLEQERNEQMARKELPGYSGYCRTRNVSADKPHVVRFKMPPKVSLQLNDMVKGTVSWDSVPMRDPVLIKSDGLALYHLAVVVDDHEMEITHVFRGIEWLPSAPLHLLLYQAFGWEPPKFAHLPVVNGPDGKKLSKRFGAQNTAQLREQGFLADAVLNYTTLVGWSPGEGVEQEIFSREELIKRFDGTGFNTASGIFDPAKLLWMNGMYIRAMPIDKFTAAVQPLLQQAGFPANDAAWAVIAPHVQERVRTLTEIPEMVEFLFKDVGARDYASMLQKGMDKPKALAIIEDALATLAQLPEYSYQGIDTALRALAERHQVKVGPAFMVVRIAVTGKKITPPLFESMLALGKEKTLERLKECHAELGAM